MRSRLHLLSALALPSILVACAAPDSVDAPEIVPRPGLQLIRNDDAAPVTRWFVELSEDPLSRGGDAGRLEAEKIRFREDLGRLPLVLTERYSFERLWSGVSVQIEAGDPAELLTLPDVRAIYPVVPFAHEAPNKGGTSPSDPNGGSVDLPPAEAELATALPMTGADIAQNTLGLTGKGIKVAVIDTGVDYDHPDLGGCFGQGCRVAFGFDFVGDAYNSSDGTTQPVPDEDPDDCAGHGTHVAGIIGANGAVKGVAPQASLGAYRVFGCTGTTDSDIMTAAMEMADKDGVRVVNMSIGSSFQWPEYPSAQAANELVKRGVVVVTSIGNTGPILYASGAPGVGDLVIGVGAIENTAIAATAFKISPDDAAIGYNLAAGAPPAPLVGNGPITRTGSTTSANDACNAVAPPAGSLTGQIALIRRGGCTFFEKSTNAMNAGAAAVILYNNTTGTLVPTVAGSPPITIPVVAITQADGVLINTHIDSAPVTLSWTSTSVSTSNPLGGRSSTFSSYGLNAELTIKPDVAAPGGNIYSTYPLEIGTYASLSGTSMASPHTAGAVALLLEARPDLTPEDVREALSNTAIPVGWAGDPTVPDAVHVQGGGMIHIDAAATLTARVTPQKLSIGETQAGPFNGTLTVKNDGAAAVTYDLSHKAAASTSGSTYTPTTSAAGAATVMFSSPELTVPAGGTATVDVTITANAAFADRGVFGGYIVFTPQGGGQTLRVPYAGLKGDYQSIVMLTSATKGYPWLSRRNVNGTFTQLASGGTFTLEGSDFPWINAHFDHAARRVVIEVYDAVKGKPYGTTTDFDYFGQTTTATGADNFAWGGTVTLNKETSVVPNGKYVLKLRALKALGDETKASDWETWTSPVVTINHP